MITNQTTKYLGTGQCTPKTTRFNRYIALLAMLFGVILGSARAQLTTADIVGTVTDATGAVIPQCGCHRRQSGYARTTRCYH